MMLQWVQQLLPGEWARRGLSLASMLMRAFCCWQSCSCCGLFSGEGTAHIIHVFIFQIVSVIMWLLLGFVLHF
jgi:hypothetical protein